MRLAEVRRGQGRSCRVESGRDRIGDAERGWVGSCVIIVVITAIKS